MVLFCVQFAPDIRRLNRASPSRKTRHPMIRAFVNRKHNRYLRGLRAGSEKRILPFKQCPSTHRDCEPDIHSGGAPLLSVAGTGFKTSGQEIAPSLYFLGSCYPGTSALRGARAGCCQLMTPPFPKVRPILQTGISDILCRAQERSGDGGLPSRRQCAYHPGPHSSVRAAFLRAILCGSH